MSHEIGQNTYEEINFLKKNDKKTKDLKEYHKEYHKSEKWKEYLSSYVNENKDLLNKKKREDRFIKKEILNIIKNCILQNTILFKNEDDLIKCCNLSRLELPNNIKETLLFKD